MKVNQLKAGSILSYAQMAIGIVVGLIYTPIMIRLLGQSEYGLYNTVASTISMLSVLSLGFNSSYIRYFSRYKKNQDDEGIAKLNGLFLLVFLIIGFISLICGLFLSNHLNLVFDTGLTAEEYRIAHILMLLLTVNLSISFPMTVFANIISANERFVFLKVLGMLKTVVGPLVTLPLLLIGYRSIAMVLVTIIVSLTCDLCYCYYVVFKLKNKFVFKNFEKGLFKSLFIYTSFIAINMIVDQINLNVDKVLLGRYKGTTAVAIYSVGFTLYTYYQMFSTSVSSVFVPRIHKLINEINDRDSQKKALTDLFIKVGRIQFLILGLVASGVCFFGKSFILNIWAGEGYDDAYVVAMLLILPSSIALIQNLGIEIQRAENKHQFRSIVYLIMAIVNLGLSIYLCQIYGAIGSAIGTAISLILANGIIMNIYYQKACNLDIIAFWKSIARLSAGLLIPIAVGAMLLCFTNQNDLWIWLLDIVAYTAIYCGSMWSLGMNKYEKNLVVGFIKKRKKT